MKKNFLITYLFLLSIFTSFAQTESSKEENKDSLKVKHFSIGLKLGFPNLASGSAELTLPILNNHFAPYIDYSKIPLNFESVETTIAYTEFGINYYFNKKANGFFLGIGKGSLSTDVTFTNLLFSSGLQSLIGSGSTELNLDTTNFKLGVKTSGTVFFRFELGYGLGKIPDSLNFIATLNGIPESFTESIPPIPGLTTSGILIGNVGFGFAF
tara:strand:+ start:360 stop:995 length:636 start_codon:yes stop_codon:yes gene_type:complete